MLYTNIQREECGNIEEHLTVTQFKVAQEQKWLGNYYTKAQAVAKRNSDKAVAAEKKLAKAKARLETAQGLNVTGSKIEQMGKKTLTGNSSITPSGVYAASWHRSHLT